MNETKQTEAAAPEGRLDALVGRVEAMMRDSQFAGDHRRVTARKVCGLFYAEIERLRAELNEAAILMENAP